MSEPQFYTQATPPKLSPLKLILIIGAILGVGLSCLITISISIIASLTLVGTRITPVTAGELRAPSHEELVIYPPATITQQGAESGDKLFRITKPGTMTPTINLVSESTLQLADFLEAQYLVVNSASSQSIHEDGYQFAEYQETIATHLLSEMINGSINNTIPVSIDGLFGTRYEISGQFYGNEATYWLTILDGKDTYYEIRAWTTNEALATNRDILLEASDSFQVIK